jgi:outer membrane protein
MKRISVIAIVISVLALCYTGWLHLMQPKYAYVNMEKLYENFSMKRELEKKLENIHNSRKMILDSMEIQLSALSHLIGKMNPEEKIRNEKIEQFEYKKQDFFVKQKAFSEEDERVTAAYQEQISKQLTQYIGDYGKQNRFSYILGADGSNSVLFANDTEDITDQLKSYVNTRYKGGSGI